MTTTTTTDRRYRLSLTRDEIFDACGALNREASHFDNLVMVAERADEGHLQHVGVWRKSRDARQKLTRKLLRQKDLNE